MMNHISLDLELEQPNRGTEVTDSNLNREKIIQVGWVVFSMQPFTVLKSRRININIGVPLSSFIKKLTGISDEDIAEGDYIYDAYDYLCSDLKEFDACRVVAQWGSGDMACLKRELSWFLSEENSWPFGRSGLNVKHVYQLFAEANGLQRSGGLSKCCARVGLEWLGRGKHNAEVDSLNSAYMLDFLCGQLTNRSFT